MFVWTAHFSSCCLRTRGCELFVGYRKFLTLLVKALLLLVTSSIAFVLKSPKSLESKAHFLEISWLFHHNF
jgi:hypothetical protein